jgi:hypothetical protein
MDSSQRGHQFPRSPEQHFTHSVKEIVPARPQVSKVKKEIIPVLEAACKFDLENHEFLMKPVFLRSPRV